MQRLARQLILAPCGRRAPELAPERPAESSIGLIADSLGNTRQRCVADAQQAGREQHAPLCQMLYRGAAHQVLEALGQYRPKTAGLARQFVQRPQPCRASVYRVQGASNDPVAHARQPAGSALGLFIHVQAEDLNKQQLGQLGQHPRAARSGRAHLSERVTKRRFQPEARV